jgi:hypothetical protein
LVPRHFFEKKTKKKGHEEKKQMKKKTINNAALIYHLFTIEFQHILLLRSGKTALSVILPYNVDNTKTTYQENVEFLQ